MAIADHIYIECYYREIIPYTHHGIDCGDGTVIHYLETNIRRTPIHQFSQGKKIHQWLYQNCDSPDIVIRRAESRLGESKYNLIFNNCENFASWCKTGVEDSKQVNQSVIKVLLDFFQWRDRDQERHYQNLFARQNQIIRQLDDQLKKTEISVPVTVQTSSYINVTSQKKPLITDKFDYRILESLLQEGCWQEADEFTFYTMLKVSGREHDRYFRPRDIDNFPREDILIIDQLWRNFSQNLFGFSVQKEIYRSLGGNHNYQYEIWENFSENVGWRINDIPILYENLCFGVNAPKGHLPHGNRIGSEIIGFLAII